MSDFRTERLAARVRAVNRANEFGRGLFVALTNIFEPLVGQKILKADGTLLEKFKKLLPPLPCTDGLHVYRHSSNYSLAWTVKTCEQIKDTHNCVYHEVVVYVGDLRGQLLEKLVTHQFDEKTYRTDYTADEVKAKRAAYDEAKRLADEARSALYPFGEYDN